MNKIKTINWRNLRKYHYKNQRIVCRKLGSGDIEDWKSNPYTFLKSKFYIETSVLLVYFLQNTKVKPNHLTFLYILFALVGGLLMASSVDILILISAILFFTRGSFDWADGYLARIKNKTTNSGRLLDIWGAKVGSISLVFGVGFYLYNKESEYIYLILLILFMFLKSMDLREFANHMLMTDLIANKDKRKILNCLKLPKSIKSRRKINFLEISKYFVKNFMDGRARTVDFLLLIVMVDNFYYQSQILNYVYFYMLFQAGAVFFGGIYTTLYKNRIFNQ
jgi:phosphatidylglycerophosphate synthase